MRFILMLILTAVSTGVAATEWVRIVGESERAIPYYDPATIRRSGNMVKMWKLSDYKKVQVTSNMQYLSSKSQSEYDCKDNRSQLLSGTLHSGNMGSGTLVFTMTAPPGNNWKPIVPGTVTEADWKIACGKQ